MYTRRILTYLFAVFVLAEARRHMQRRDITSICDTTSGNPNSIFCYCSKDPKHLHIIQTANCFLNTKELKHTDPAWDSFSGLNLATKLTIFDNKGIPIKYVPTHALKYLENLAKLDIKNADIERVHAYAFGNLTSLDEIWLPDNQIKVLEANAFAHLNDLTEIKLDKNRITEINRNVFVDLPSLERLYITENQLTTIHDKAFLHLNNLRELELNRNKLFSLNSESFSGLKRLQKLDLSSNSLEVIGDNTFLPLKSLESLNLEENNIQMLDEKAFNGLIKLRSLSLAHNRLSSIENEKVFEGLFSLKTLSLRANDIKELKPQVMAPLLTNLKSAEGNLDVEDTSFPCDCRLEWFMTLMNNTNSTNLKIVMENFKCIPDTKLKEKWDEEGKNSENSSFEEHDKESGQDFEYYDDSQLNGKLFYTDVREMINCNKDKKVETTTKADILLRSIPLIPKVDNARKHEETRTPILNQGTLDLTTPKDEIENVIVNDKRLYTPTPKPVTKDVVVSDKKTNAYTTTRLVTVSAKPEENYERMAADEAKPDKFKASRSRSLQDEFKPASSNGIRNTPRVVLIAFLFLRLFHYL